ncbi:MAG TPA: hypothetical protein VFC63_20830 [Blastocatellia bacterium]|nr:hypothetical protein [Blastocatellia bacterium]
MSELTEWNSFYVIVGSAAGALIGLQFVALSLIAQRPVRRMEEGSAAFSTPTIVHFGAVLLLSAIVSIPWRGTGAISVLLGLAGLGGIFYAAIVTRRMIIQTVYKPVFEDWMFHAVLPFVAYAMLVSSAFVAYSRVRPAMFVVSAATLLFLFIGVHNSWDAVTYHIFTKTKNLSNGSAAENETGSPVQARNEP